MTVAAGLLFIPTSLLSLCLLPLTPPIHPREEESASFTSILAVCVDGPVSAPTALDGLKMAIAYRKLARRKHRVAIVVLAMGEDGCGCTAIVFRLILYYLLPPWCGHCCLLDYGSHHLLFFHLIKITINITVIISHHFPQRTSTRSRPPCPTAPSAWPRSTMWRPTRGRSCGPSKPRPRSRTRWRLSRSTSTTSTYSTGESCRWAVFL